MCTKKQHTHTHTSENIKILTEHRDVVHNNCMSYVSCHVSKISWFH